MNKRLVLLCVLNIMTICLFAQKINIKGTVVDSLSGERLMYANCMLQYKTDTVGIYKGEVTDTDGVFLFKKVKKRDLVLKITYVGYKMQRLEIKASDFVSGKDIDLGQIKMSLREDLDAVEITAQRKRIEIDDDKMMVNVDDAMAGMVNNAFDLLRLVPGVMIDQEENLTLNGQSGVQFQYNGREMKMDWEGVKDMLKSMTPEMIDQFEVLKNPGVRYDAEGTAGIINIRLKKDQHYGINGSVNANLGLEDKYNYSFREGVRLNFVNDKWIIYGGYSHYNSHYGQEYMADSSHRYTWLADDTTFFRSYSGETKRKNNGNSFDISASYSLDSTSTLSLDARYFRNNTPPDETVSPMFLSHNPTYYNIDSSNYTTTGSKSNSQRWNVSLGYVKQLDKEGSKLSADAVYNGNTSLSSSLSEIAYYKGAFRDESMLNRRQGYKRENDNQSHNVSFRADYYKPLGKGNRFEAGAKSNVNYSNRDYTSLLYNGTQYVNNPSESNQFKYTENVNSLYASLTNKYFNQKLSVRLGIRAEQTNTKGEQTANDTIITRHYFNLFPNVRLGWKFSDKREINVNYTYRLSRPWSESLNPFVKKNSDYSYSTGNPELEPSYSHRISLSYSSDFVFFPSVTYFHSYNNRETLTIPMNDSYNVEYNPLAVMSYPINLGTSDNISANISYSKSIGMSIFISLNGGLGYSHVESTKNNINVSNEGFTYSFSANAFGSLPHDIRLSMFFMYFSANIGTFGKSTGWSSLNLSLSKDFFKKSLNASVSCSINGIRQHHSTTEYLNYKNESWEQPNLPYWHLGLRYKFGKFYQNKQVQKQQLQNLDDDTSEDRQGREMQQ